jgi:3-mercaptopyruvate sulfurtransferase SseA
MKRAVASILAVLATVAFLAASANAAKQSEKKSFPDIPRITKEQLTEKLADPDIVILDVRPEQQWKGTKLKILGAIHEDPTAIESWAGKYPKDKTIVLY